MKQWELYEKPIDRKVNPAVSATDLNAETIKIEIDEYVFTDEIIKGLYEVIDGIRNHNVSHNGIWINGYYGSGKSHFLKYLTYCLTPEYSEKALARLEEAVSSRMEKDVSYEPTNSDIADINAWVNHADVHTILFNIGTVHNSNGNGNETFVEVFWNQFNAYRGMNSFDPSLAYFLELPLLEAGKLDEFKNRLKQQNYDWDERAYALASTQTDMILGLAKELVPTLSIDVIREHIKHKDLPMSVENFCGEIKRYADAQSDNFRLLFMVDEVSQFINNNRGLLLQLQQVVTELATASSGKVWAICTAQQDLSEILSSVGFNTTTEDYGKIMGRFEIRVPLVGTSDDEITRIRILSKKPEKIFDLQELYKQERSAIDTQFDLPASYHAYQTQEDFVNYYPFVPYQFRLIKQVLDNFVQLQFIDKQNKGTERAIIKITHNTAKQTMNEEVGDVISFDRFYNSTLAGTLTASGQRFIANGIEMIKTFSTDEDKNRFARRVLNVLFMICNLSPETLRVFPATVNNLCTLLMDKLDESRLDMKQRVTDVLDFLEKHNILRHEDTEHSGSIETVYSFYSEAEREVAALIASQNADQSTMAEVLKNTYVEYIGFKPKVSHYSRFATIGLQIYGRNFFNTNNPDVWVKFEFDNNDVNMLAFNNNKNTLMFVLTDGYNKTQVSQDFYWYCQVQKYLQSIPAPTREREEANEGFRKRAETAFNENIRKRLYAIFDECDVISGNDVITNDFTTRGSARYEGTLTRHFKTLYPYAACTSGINIPTTPQELASRIRRPFDDNEYSLTPLSEGEMQIDQQLQRNAATTTVAHLFNLFEGAPYGWSNIYTADALNELVRRRKWAFAYQNNHNVEIDTIANKLLKESQNFTMVQAVAIPQDLITRFTKCWKDIFGVAGSSAYSSDGEALYRQCNQTDKKELLKYLPAYRNRYSRIASYPFAHFLNEAVEMMSAWHDERDAKTFFEKVVAQHDEARELFDKCKEIISFCNDFVLDSNENPNGKYPQMLEFVRDNRENLDNLRSSFPDEVDRMKGILSDEWPIDKLPVYGKLMQKLQNLLKEECESWRQKISETYTKVYDDLEKLAEEKGVDKSILGSRQQTIMRLTTPSSINSLRLNYNDAHDFYQQQIEAINAAVAQKATSETPSAATKVIRSVKVKKNVHLHTAQEVDDYINELRTRLMDVINNNQEAMTE